MLWWNEPHHQNRPKVNRVKTVLIIDDDPEMRALLKAAIGMGPYLAVEAENGAVALEKLGSLTPKLILLDLSMPILNGEEFLREISKNKNWKNIPILLTSAKEDLSIREFFSQIEGVLPKPFTLTELLAAVEKHIS